MFKILLLIVMLSGLSYAQYREYDRDDKNLRFGIGVTAAYFNPVDADNGGIMGGLVARAKFMEYFGIEFSVNYRSEDYAGDFVSVTTVPILLTALVYPADFIYGLLGVGYYNTSINYSNINIPGINLDDESSSELGTHFGLGLTFPVLEQYRMFGDVRYHFAGYELKRIINNATTTENYDVNADFLSINLGILFEF